MTEAEILSERARAVHDAAREHAKEVLDRLYPEAQLTAGMIEEAFIAGAAWMEVHLELTQNESDEVR
jgi:hypothetical protein